LEQTFAACMPLLMAASACDFGRRHYASPQQCYLHHLCLCTDKLSL